MPPARQSFWRFTGIPNTDYREGPGSARLRATDAETATQRVRAALAGESFTIAGATGRNERPTPV